MSKNRLKHFGWGREGEGLTPARRLSPRRYRKLFGVEDLRRLPAAALAEIALRPPRIAAARARSRSARRRSTSAPRTPTANRFPRPCAACSATTPMRRTWSRFRATKARWRRSSTGPARPRPRSPPSAAAAASSAVSSRGRRDPLQGRRHPRPAPLDRVLGDRPHLARGAHPGRHLRPGAGGALRPHGLTLRHFPQSFEFSTLGGWIATRSRRPFRDALHPHRRLRRERCAW